MKYTTTLWGAQTFLRKTRCIHNNVSISTTENRHLKSGSTLQKLPGWGVNNTPFWQQRHFMQTIRLLTHIQKTWNTPALWGCIDFSQQNNMHTSQHQYIPYRKPSLKIGPDSPEAPPPECVNNTTHVAIQPSGKWEGSRLVLTTNHIWYWPRFHWQSRCAWGAKNSSASEQLKHPIWSLGNSRAQS